MQSFNNCLFGTFLLLFSFLVTAQIGTEDSIAYSSLTIELDTIYSVADSKQFNLSEVCAIHNFKQSNDGACIRAISLCQPKSTDVSPPLRLIIAFAKNSEMSNTYALFDLGHIWSINNYYRKEAGIYCIAGTQYKEGMMVNGISDILIELDTRKVWQDDDEFVKKHKEDFADGVIDSKIYLKTTFKKRR